MWRCPLALVRGYGDANSMLRFGVTFVAYANDQKRDPKKSAKSLKPLFDSLIKKD